LNKNVDSPYKIPFHNYKTKITKINKKKINIFYTLHILPVDMQCVDEVLEIFEYDDHL
jgi:hypothetical protein